MLFTPGTSLRFVDAVYRRLVLLRILEQLGRGFFVSSLLACVLLLAAIWQSISTTPILIFCAVLGIGIGICLSVVRWPTRWSAAEQADRQLQLDDLLTTALYCSMSGNDFDRMVIASADTRCAKHSPSEVLLRQLGVRSWSGIGLAMSIAITLAVIPFGAVSSRATDSGNSILSFEPSEMDRSNNQSQPASAANSPANPNAEPESQGASNEKMTAADSEIQTHSNLAGSPGDSTSGHQRGRGAGANATHDPQQPIQNAPIGSQRPIATGVTAGGGEILSNVGKAGAAGGLAGSAPAVIVPRWSGESSRPPAGFDPAIENSAPPEDREILRQFFQK